MSEEDLEFFRIFALPVLEEVGMERFCHFIRAGYRFYSDGIQAGLKKGKV